MVNRDLGYELQNRKLKSKIENRKKSKIQNQNPKSKVKNTKVGVSVIIVLNVRGLCVLVWSMRAL